jgi:hypothetical protein
MHKQLKEGDLLKCNLSGFLFHYRNDYTGAIIERKTIKDTFVIFLSYKMVYGNRDDIIDLTVIMDGLPCTRHIHTSYVEKYFSRVD